MAMVSGVTPYLLTLSGWTGYTPTLPKLYWDVYSQEERIKRLCMGVDRIEKYCDYVAETVNSDLADVDEALQETLNEVQAELVNFKTEITKMILDMEIGTLQWDCQTGWYESTVEAQRDMFNDLTVHAITVEQLNELEMTVDELSECGLNVRGLAVMSYWLINQFELPDGMEYEETGDGN